MKTKRRSEFPIEVSEGAVTVKIYRSESKRGYVSFVVAYSLKGKQTVKSFADLGEAKTEAKNIASQIAAGDQSGVFLRGEDRVLYQRATSILKPLGIALDTAAQEYADGRALLKGAASVLEACREYARRHGAVIGKILVSDAVEKMIRMEVAEQGPRRKAAWVKLLRTHLQNKFAARFRTFVQSVEAKDIAEWLSGLTVSERTKKNIRDVVCHFFKWCRAQGYMPKDADPMVDVQDYRKRRIGAVSILTPDDLVKLLVNANSELVPYLALRAFAGLRDSEASLIEWQHIELADKADDAGRWGWITITDEVAKQAAHDDGVRRLAPVRAVLRDWLLPHVKRTGKIAPFANMQKQARKLAADVGVTWKRNCLRHSYISYAIAESADVPRVAMESGNSPEIIRRHYLRVVRPEASKIWFGVSPGLPGNVTKLPESGNKVLRQYAATTGLRSAS
jgi:integrase